MSPDDALNAALQEADLRTLLMTLFQYTGDETWLSPPFTPKRDVRLIPDPAAGLAPELQAEVRRAAYDVLRSRSAPVIADPGNVLLARMMSVCTGEAVPPEYAPMVREEMGLVDRTPRWRAQPSPEALGQIHVLIVGAGASGISLAVTLGRLGIPYTIVEMRDEIGGAWYANQYPGCGVDTPNHCYSFSFGKRFAWSRYFAQREEVQTYLEGVVAEFGIRPRIRFNTKLVASRWDGGARCWRSMVEGPRGREEIVSACSSPPSAN